MTEMDAQIIDMQPGLSRNGKRLWSKAQKKLIVGETLKPGMSVSLVSRKYNINANQIFRWIREAGLPYPGSLIPVGVVEQPLVQNNVIPPVGSSASSGESCRLIEIELGSRAKIRIDGDVRLPVVEAVLKMVRSLA